MPKTRPRPARETSAGAGKFVPAEFVAGALLAMGFALACGGGFTGPPPDPDRLVAVTSIDTNGIVFFDADEDDSVDDDGTGAVRFISFNAGVGRSGFFGLTADLENEELFVSQADQAQAVLVYNLRASGSVLERRALLGALTELDAPSRIFLDRSNDELYVTNEFGSGPGGVVTVFEPTDIGNVRPLRRLALDAHTTPFDVIDSAIVIGDEVWVTGRGDSTSDPVGAPNAIFVFDRLANCEDGEPVGPAEDCALLRVIQGPATGLEEPWDLAYAAAADELLVSQGSGSVLIFDLADLADTSAGTAEVLDVAPVRTITGPATMLERAVGLDYDPVADEIYVVNETEAKILVFDRSVDGDAVPSRFMDLTMPGGIDIVLDVDFVD